MHGRTAEGLSTCMETGYQWTINSTTWNHLQAMWRAPPLDLLRLIHEETHHQAILEAGGYRSPTWRTLRALTSIFQANVVVGESMIKQRLSLKVQDDHPSRFGGPSKGDGSFCGRAYARRTRRSVSPTSKVTNPGLSGAKPSRKTYMHSYSGSMGNAFSLANAREGKR